MKTRLVIALSGLMFTTNINAENWFHQNNALTRAHQYLLEDDLPRSFSSMIEVWQQEATNIIGPHLNSLFSKALEKDCGKSLSVEALPKWVSSVTVKQQSLQRPGRMSYSMTVHVESSEALRSITAIEWPEKSISKESSFSILETDQAKHAYQQYYTLNHRLENGLYRIKIVNEIGEIWNSWLILGDEANDHSVRWTSKDTWQVKKSKLLNPYCPLPVQHVSVFDYVGNDYKKVWENKYESSYPSKLQVRSLPPERYVLTISMTHARWQGSIRYEDQQIISKTLDLTDE